ncbi:MAG: hypothetical protein Q7Q73_00715 [Verrucomicrobiota bacterium JB024]|nr:hypothetical protein [Verrucomicrobiota bacterium JB024]
MMKIIPNVCVALLLGLASSLYAQNTNYPTEDMKFSPENSGKSGEVFTITQPIETTGMSKWNTVTIRIPGILPYSADLVIKGKVMLQSETRPHHLGLIVECTSGKQLFAKAPLPTGEPTSFSLPLSAFKVADSSKNPEPPTEQDQLQSIRVYASFAPEEAESSFKLESFSLTAGASNHKSHP